MVRVWLVTCAFNYRYVCVSWYQLYISLGRGKYWLPGDNWGRGWIVNKLFRRKIRFVPNLQIRLGKSFHWFLSPPPRPRPPRPRGMYDYRSYIAILDYATTLYRWCGGAMHVHSYQICTHNFFSDLNFSRLYFVY